jgi:hypothetical protein
VLSALRYIYRRFLLFFVPVRAYKLESALTPIELLSELRSCTNEDKLYFLRKGQTNKPYLGRIDLWQFLLVKSGKSAWQRRIKIKGYFIPNEKNTLISLTLSTPLSPFNFLFIGIFYGILLFAEPKIFNRLWLNALLYLLPLFIAYFSTALSFRKVYRQEKRYFFTLFKARRIPEN